MSRRGRRSAVDPAAAVRYQRVAASLLRSAADLGELAAEGDRYGNAIGIVAIHAAIAYADALCVRFAGFKSGEGDHTRALDALREALGARAHEGALRKLQRVLARKDQVSYQGTYYTVEDARKLVDDTRAFAAWAEDLLRYTPAS